MASGSGTPDDPWVLTTPSGGSEYTLHREPDAEPPALVCQVGSTQLRYHLSAIDDLHHVAITHALLPHQSTVDQRRPAACNAAPPDCGL